LHFIERLIVAVDFDPYHRWLGIPPGERPPNHYRMLGVELFETDMEVIDYAADRQLTYLRSFRQGPNGALAETLMNGICAARLCLSDPARRAEYDAELRSMMVVPVAINQVPPLAEPPVSFSPSTSGVPAFEPLNSPKIPPVAQPLGFQNSSFEPVVDATPLSETVNAVPTPIAPAPVFIQESGRSTPLPFTTTPSTTPLPSSSIGRRRRAERSPLLAVSVILISGIAGLISAVVVAKLVTGRFPFESAEVDRSSSVAQSDEDARPKLRNSDDSTQQGNTNTNRPETGNTSSRMTRPAKENDTVNDGRQKDEFNRSGFGGTGFGVGNPPEEKVEIATNPPAAEQDPTKDPTKVPTTDPVPFPPRVRGPLPVNPGNAPADIALEELDAKSRLELVQKLSTDMLGNVDESQRMSSARTLSRIVPPPIESLPSLKVALETEASDVVKEQVVAAIATTKSMAADLVSDLGKIVDETKNDNLRAIALQAIIEIDPESVIVRRLLTRALVGHPTRRNVVLTSDRLTTDNRIWACGRVKLMGTNASWAIPILLDIMEVYADQGLDSPSGLQTYQQAIEACFAIEADNRLFIRLLEKQVKGLTGRYASDAKAFADSTLRKRAFDEKVSQVFASINDNGTSLISMLDYVNEVTQILAVYSQMENEETPAVAQGYLKFQLQRLQERLGGNHVVLLKTERVRKTATGYLVTLPIAETDPSNRFPGRSSRAQTFQVEIEDVADKIAVIGDQSILLVKCDLQIGTMQRDSFRRLSLGNAKITNVSLAELIN
jgi:hypothetical protein